MWVVLSAIEAIPYLELMILSSCTSYLAELTDQRLKPRFFLKEIVPIIGPVIPFSLAQIPADKRAFLVSASVFLSITHRKYIY